MNHSHFRKHWILSLFLLLSITMLLTGCEERTENQMEVSETADINQTKSHFEEINFSHFGNYRIDGRGLWI